MTVSPGKQRTPKSAAGVVEKLLKEGPDSVTQKDPVQFESHASQELNLEHMLQYHSMLNALAVYPYWSLCSCMPVDVYNGVRLSPSQESYQLRAMDVSPRRLVQRGKSSTRVKHATSCAFIHTQSKLGKCDCQVSLRHGGYDKKGSGSSKVCMQR
jgi:hypothetical protein